MSDKPQPSPPAAYRAMLTATDGIVREVVELHGPTPHYVYSDGSVSWWMRKGCEATGYEWEPADWPCRTTELIAERLGVSLRDDAYVVDGEQATRPAVTPA